MTPDKFAALWLSHSSIGDFLDCPRAYYLANVYKNPRTGKKISIINPPLALGQAVHNTIDHLSNLSVAARFKEPIETVFEKSWSKISGEKGGFKSETEESEYKQRGSEMIAVLANNPGPVKKKAIKLKEMVPYYWFSEEENLILCGKIDWIEYLEATDSVHIIDFKTGRREEKEDSLQFPIYLLLAKHCQSRGVSKMSYWYLGRSETLHEVSLPDEKASVDKIMKIGLRIKLAKQLNHFKCGRDEQNGCFACAPLELVVKGKGKFVGINEMNKETYILTESATSL